MPIRTQLLKKWVGPDPEKHIGSTPLHTAADEQWTSSAADSDDDDDEQLRVSADETRLNGLAEHCDTHRL